MEGGENHEPPRFCIEVNVPKEERKLAVLWLHHGVTLQSAVEAITVFGDYKSKDSVKDLLSEGKLRYGHTLDIFLFIISFGPQGQLA